MTYPTSRLALVVRGGWEGHEPVAATDLFLPFLREHGYDVLVHGSPDVYADAELMSRADVVVQCYTQGELTDAAAEGLRAAVRAGTGLAGWHGGIVDAFRSNTGYLQLTGGQFTSHPAKAAPAELEHDGTDCFVRHIIRIEPETADHPIVAGIGDFELTTEQYWVLTDDYCDVLATTTLAAPEYEPWARPVTCPAVWTRSWGSGRVFVATPGHSIDIVSDPNVRTIIERGILWASR